MSSPIKQAFDQIKADQDLIQRTKQSLLGERLTDGRIRALSDRPLRHYGRRPARRVLAVAMAVVLLTGLVAVAGLALVRVPVAAVSLDINPSITIQVNALHRVISMTGHNEAGRRLVAVDLINRPVRTAISRLVAEAARSGYLAEDGSSIISITTSADVRRLKGSIGTEAGEAAMSALQETEQTAVVYQDYTGLDRVREAKTLDISPGRLNLIRKLASSQDEVELEDYSAMDNREIMEKVVAMKKEQKDQEKEMEQALKKAQDNADLNRQNQGKGNGSGQGKK